MNRNNSNALLLFLISVAFSTILNAQPSTFEKTYGTQGYDRARSVCNTYDGGFALTGVCQIGFDQQLILLKTNSNGDSLWSKIFSNNKGCDGWSIKETFDKGFIIAGYIYHFSVPQDLYILKTDSVGNLLWSKILTHTSGLYALSIIQDFDSNFVACGYISNFTQNPALYVCKLDVNGDTLWTTSINYFQGIAGWYIANTNDGNYIVVGTGYSNNGSSNNVVLVKIDKSGNTVWQKVFGGNNSEYGLCVKPTADNCYLVTGYSTDTSYTVTEALLIKTDSLGNLIWQKTIPASSWKAAWHFAELPGFEGYIITGQERISPLNNNNDVYLLKTDTAGNQIWSKHIGYGYDEHGHTIILTNDGGFAISGFTKSIGNGDYDLYLIKTDTSGNIFTGVPDPIEIHPELNIYPNPVSSKLTIDSISSADFTVVNVFGEIIISKVFSSTIIGKFELDVSTLAAGIYFIKTGNEVRKFVKE